MKALISGVAGQDGSYLAELLVRKGYGVVGTSRDSMITSFSNLERLGIQNDLQTTSMAINDFRSVLNVVWRHQPGEISKPERFVTQKIVRADARISLGSGETLQLGNIDIWRDWGRAPDYVDAMWRILQQSMAEDFVYATGKTNSSEYLVSTAFAFLNLSWKNHVKVNASLFRPSDINQSSANPSKAKRILDREAKVDLESVIERMCETAVAIDMKYKN